MALTPTQQQTFQTWLSRHNGTYSCPVCNKRSFAAGDIIVNNIERAGGFAIGGGMRFLPLICTDCGNVTLFEAGTIGL